ncbi:hypothetical protein [Candidatus Nitrosotenuis cloacae]|uniref:hypothetical protein n=1 Tax=Candidatus Nitrosotenuis cloacae TaxID=1603555 RepID=UPI00227F3330|nr:hypothetical protein [Candidatus Nitrosotenuis cloacae]
MKTKPIHEASHTAKIAGAFDVVEPQTLDRITEVLSILSKGDALEIFVLARAGLRSDLDTPTKIGLTKKQYYTRLKQLVDAGLLDKVHDTYTHTSLGRIVFQKHIVALAENIQNSKNLEIIDVLKKTPRFNDDDIASFLSKVGMQSDLLEASDGAADVTVSFDEMVRKVLSMIEFAQKEILLVTRFANEMIINALLKKANAGVTVRVLADVHLVESYYRGEDKVHSDDANREERVSVVSNPYYPSKVMRNYVKIPFCAIIVDGKQVGLELVDLNEPQKLSATVFLSNMAVAAKIRGMFDQLWRKSSPNPPQTSKVKLDKVAK